MATKEQLEADRAALVLARMDFLTKGSVKEVARDGRRLVKNMPTLADLDGAITSIDTQLAQLLAAETGSRRRRAFTLSFG